VETIEVPGDAGVRFRYSALLFPHWAKPLMHSAKLVNPIRNNLFTNRELGEEENSSLREFKDMLPVRFGLGVGRSQFKNEPETFHTD